MSNTNLSKYEVQENYDPVEVSIESNKEKFPHNGKKISEMFCSPNIKYIATISSNDKSIYGWSVTEGQSKLNFDYSINWKDSKLILWKASDSKHIFLQFDKDGSYNSEVIDFTTGSKQILNAQGLKGRICEAAFLENGDLVVVKGDPVYRAYVFSISNSNNKYKWSYINGIELIKYYKRIIVSKGKLLILLEIPFVIMQWDVMTRKFDVQYVLDWNLTKDDLCVELNGDSTLLAVAGNVFDLEYKSTVYIYSTESGILLASSTFDNEIEEMYFIGTNEGERLLVYCGACYIMTPHYLTDVTDAEEILDIKLSNKSNFIFSSYVIGVHDNNLQTYSCGKEIWKIIQKYISSQGMTHDHSRKEYDGKTYTWIVECSQDYISLTVNENKTQNQVGEINIYVRKNDANEFLAVFEMLENEDLMLISSFGIQIWTINTINAHHECHLLYYWSSIDTFKRFKSKTTQQALIAQLNFLKDKFDHQSLPPPPYFDQIIEYSNDRIYKCGSKYERCSICTRDV
ncbi:12678_t:CDS:2 [Cetraspora pellucida]|uniref:12678_t:CDS:1 n=1 Tax=Cetraspora pellucida TaxID=1433469 RepID=A0ACA9L4C8_9GLOM|nr:12678_t:CDS:2 [Cetraspora pellucida]